MRVHCPVKDYEFYLAEFSPNEWNERNPIDQNPSERIIIALSRMFQVGTLAGVYGVGDDSYTVKIIGGTGLFADANGKLSFIGVLDTSQGKVVLRYQGTVCFAQPEH
jgi:hypothetical protein